MLLVDMEQSGNFPVAGVIVLLLIIVVFGHLHRRFKNIREMKESEKNPLTIDESYSGTSFLIIRFKEDKVLLRNNDVHNSHSHLKNRYFKKDSIPVEFRKKKKWFKVTYTNDKLEFAWDTMHHYI